MGRPFTILSKKKRKKNLNERSTDKSLFYSSKRTAQHLVRHKRRQEKGDERQDPAMLANLGWKKKVLPRAFERTKPVFP